MSQLEALAALIADLYAQIAVLQQELAEARARGNGGMEDAAERKVAQVPSP